MTTCAMLVTRHGQKFLVACGKPATAMVGRLEVCTEHQRERRKPVRKRGQKRGLQ